VAGETTEGRGRNLLKEDSDMATLAEFALQVRMDLWFTEGRRDGFQEGLAHGQKPEHYWQLVTSFRLANVPEDGHQKYVEGFKDGVRDGIKKRNEIRGISEEIDDETA
jgi:hypothetical protein